MKKDKTRYIEIIELLKELFGAEPEGYRPDDKELQLIKNGTGWKKKCNGVRRLCKPL
ncbi:MAG: hypothetical protein WEA56_10820 [Balneolaceae bacterium]